MKMKAAVLYDNNLPRPFRDSKPLVIEEVDLDPPGPGEVLVEIRAAGLCHSDLSAINGSRPRKLPSIPGHEAAGIVREVGQGVTGVAVGDHVVTIVVTTCGKCGNCLNGRPNLCEATKEARANGTLQTGARRLHIGNTPLNHYSGLSIFAQYAVCSEQSLVPIAKDIPFEFASLFGCAVVTGVGAVMNTAKVPAGVSAAVVGLGGVGLSAIMGLVAVGALPIVAVDPIQSKLDMARAMGATHAVQVAGDKFIDEIRDLTNGGVEFAFEMAGSIPAMNTAYAITRRGGTTVTAGLPDLSKSLALNHSSIVTEERTVKGSYMGSCVPGRDIPKFLELYKNAKLPVEKLYSRTIGFDEINAAFDELDSGNTIRQVLNPHL